MLGEELNSSYVTERGLVGDRTYAVVDQKTGKVASAKNPRKWGKLFDFRSVFIEPPQLVENRSVSPSQMGRISSRMTIILITHCQKFLSKTLGL